MLFSGQLPRTEAPLCCAGTETYQQILASASLDSVPEALPASNANPQLNLAVRLIFPAQLFAPPDAQTYRHSMNMLLKIHAHTLQC